VVRNKFVSNIGTNTAWQLNVRVIWHGLQHEWTLYLKISVKMNTWIPRKCRCRVMLTNGWSGNKLICRYAMNLLPFSLNTLHITVDACIHLDYVSVIFCRRFRRIARIDSSFRQVCLPAWTHSAPSRRIFKKFNISWFLEYLLRNDLYGYTVHLLQQTLYYPTNTHSVKT
jgi:hypothetical protein